MKTKQSIKLNGNELPPQVIPKRTASNEKKASKVLGIIFAVFVVVYGPLSSLSTFYQLFANHVWKP